MLQDHTNHPYALQQGAIQPGSDGKTDQIQTLVTHLVRQYADASRTAPMYGRKLDDMPRGNLARYEAWLAEAYHYFSERAQKKLFISLASEWILDNYYVIRQALIEIKESLPPGYYRQLPHLTEGPYKNLPRIYALAGAVLSYQHDLFEPIELETIFVRLQEQVALTTGELWALPIFLRYCLIESLAHTLVAVIQPSELPLLPELIFVPNGSGEDAQAANHENAAGAASDRIANIVLSFRAISELDWKDFFEAVSALEATLRQDPAGVYEQMDFATRDVYRNEIEELSFASGRNEVELAKMALKLAQEAASHSPIEETPLPAAGALSQHKADQDVLNRQAAHIGNYLLGYGRAELEQRIGYRPDLRTAIQRWAFRYPTFVYLSSVAAVIILFFVILTFPAHLPEMYSAIFTPEKSFPWEPAFATPNSVLLWGVLVLLTLALLAPMLTMATSLVNWMITLLIRPRVLPKLDFKKEIPVGFTTLVAIPAFITRQDEIDSLAQQIELHYLRNPEPGLRFGLLTDFSDADRETEPEDEILVNYALAKIKSLNLTYPLAIPDGSSLEGGQRFMLFHRKRLWNPSEGKWMGWERKRGKLHELNQLLRGRENLSFITPTQLDPRDQAALRQLRFVITLDADTILPLGAAHRLAGTLAHPLNRAVFDPESGVVRSGYTVLQPRMEIHPKSANLSWFTRIFAGDAGLDLYTLAVSDAYQDLFGEGMYVGKGIYDVDAFQRSVDADIPENRVLSHDLLEGLMGRAGLVADITMVEDYPQNYLIQILRQRRWIRGDWQLLPWLINPRRFGIHFSVIDRWKIFDNLIRSLLAPTLVVIFVLGLIFLPGLAGLWTALVALALGIPLLTGLARSSLQILADEPARSALRPLGWNFLRWILAISFLIYEAYISVDAIFTTLYRLFISRRDLLQWTTAAQTTRLFRLNRRQNVGWQKMGVSVIAALILIFGLLLISDLNRRGLAMVFFYAAIILLLWMLSPLIVWFINRPIPGKIIPLDNDQEIYLQQIARQTWGFFERFVGPEDHWLPPDHYQEFPAAKVAHRTSPTNMGLLLTSTWAAYDLGYLDLLGLVTRLETTTETLTQLERFNGHFFNWYDTLSLKPLKPAYISAVDSGNLAASMIVTTQACQALPADPILRWDVWQTSYLAALTTLKEAIPQSSQSDFSLEVEEIHDLISRLQAEILSLHALPERWYTLFQKASGTVWKDISERLMEWVRVGLT